MLTERVGMIDSLTKTDSASRASYLESAQLLFQQRAELAEECVTLLRLRSGALLASFILSHTAIRGNQLTASCRHTDDQIIRIILRSGELIALLKGAS